MERHIATLVSDVLARLNDPHATAASLALCQQTPYDQRFWSKGPSYALVPLESELCGFAPSRRLKTRPASDRNLYEYRLAGGHFIEATSRNRDGVTDQTQVFFSEHDALYSLRFDNEMLPISMSKATMDNGIITSALRVDVDGDYWHYDYLREQGQITQMIANCSNSPPGFVLHVTYEDDQLAGIHTLRGEERIYTYQRKRWSR